VPADAYQANHWYAKAAAAGHPGGQAGLGYMHYRGEGGAAQDPAQAAEWFRKAASQGHARAQQHLASRYLTGDGIEKSPTNAYMWFILAIRGGNKAAQKHKDAVAAELTTAERLKAEQMAESWRPSTAKGKSG